MVIVHVCIRLLKNSKFVEYEVAELAQCSEAPFALPLHLAQTCVKPDCLLQGATGVKGRLPPWYALGMLL